MKSMKRRTSRRGAFTLMEVLLVLVILAVLGSLAIPMLSSTQKKALMDNAKIQANSISNAVDMFYIDMNRYPTSDEGLDVLVNEPSSKPSGVAKWRGPYLKKEPIDPWGNPYKILEKGKHNPNGVDIYSMGPDGEDGTEDDVGNWDNTEA